MTMFEITITEIRKANGDGAALERSPIPERIERFKQTVDELNFEAVIKAVNGITRKRKTAKAGKGAA